MYAGTGYAMHVNRAWGSTQIWGDLAPPRWHWYWGLIYCWRCVRGDVFGMGKCVSEAVSVTKTMICSALNPFGFVESVKVYKSFEGSLHVLTQLTQQCRESQQPCSGQVMVLSTVTSLDVECVYNLCSLSNVLALQGVIRCQTSNQVMLILYMVSQRWGSILGELWLKLGSVLKRKLPARVCK